MSAMSSSQVCGFIATIMSTPPRRPRWPVFANPHLEPGRQALDVRRKDVARARRDSHAQDRLGEQRVGAGRARSVDVGEFDDEVVDAFDALSTGSVHGYASGFIDAGEAAERIYGFVSPRPRSSRHIVSSARSPLPTPRRRMPGTARPCSEMMKGIAPNRASRRFFQRAAAGGAGPGQVEEEFAHVPGTGRAALGAQPAMQAHIFVLGHDPAGLQPIADVQILLEVQGRGHQPLAQLVLGAVVGEGDAVHRADVDAGVAFDAELPGEHGLHVAIEAPLGFEIAQLFVIAELDLDPDVRERHRGVAQRHPVAQIV